MTKPGIGPDDPTAHVPGDPIEAQIAAWAEETALPYYEPRFRRIMRVVLPAMVAALFGSVATVIILHVIETPKTVTVTKTVPAQSVFPVSSDADERFTTALATKGISAGMEVLRQRFMEMGHHTCFNLAPPDSQPMNLIVQSIMATENADVKTGNDPWAPTFTLEDAQNVAQSAVAAYCPQFSNLAR